MIDVTASHPQASMMGTGDSIAASFTGPWPEVLMKSLVALGIVLLVAWVAGFLVFKIAGFLIHVLLIVGAVLLLIGLARRVGRGISSGT